jgi:hypothetical protein
MVCSHISKRNRPPGEKQDQQEGEVNNIARYTQNAASSMIAFYTVGIGHGFIGATQAS